MIKTTDWFGRIPWTIVIVAGLLIAAGLAGIARADELIDRGDDLFGRQVVWVVLALPTMFAATMIPYRNLRRFSVPLFGLSLLLLVVVYFMPARNGAHRWIPLGVMQLQPSELAKLAFIMALAHYLMYRRNYRRLPGLLVPFVLTLLPVGLILREPDLGTSLVFLPVLFAMLFAAGARPRHLALIMLLGVSLSPALWMAMSAEQKSRIVTLFVQRDGGPAPTGDGYQLHHSKQVLAMGGLWGSAARVPADDNQTVNQVAGKLDLSAETRSLRLPAARTDFVFCLIGERFGLAGCLIVLLLYGVLFARGLSIAAATREPYGRLLAVGIITLLAAQTAINAGMTVGLMPITGMTLPLMSYGGSSLLSTCLALGLLMNVGMRPGYEMTPEPFRFRDDG